MFEIFKSNLNMFLDLPGSCGQTKNQSLEQTDYWNVFSDWLVLAVGSFEDIIQIHIFVPFKENIFKNFDSQN